SRLIGRALAPEPDSDETSPLANQVVVLLTYDDQGNIVSAEVGTTDANGQFIVDAEAQAVVAVVVGAMTDEGDTEISGLFNPDEPVIEKDLDEATSIACAAGLTAIGDGSITEEQLNAERVQNLEAASVEYILANPDFDYYSETDRTSAVEAVRVATDDGAHPAASDAFTA
ncbi:MAG: hypothetical protein GQ551_06885, partial [Myxococcales bacterium]|nr:hypothetical protein [Myxococcales bacterium]